MHPPDEAEKRRAVRLPMKRMQVMVEVGKGINHSPVSGAKGGNARRFFFFLPASSAARRASLRMKTENGLYGWSRLSSEKRNTLSYSRTTATLPVRPVRSYTTDHCVMLVASSVSG